MLILCDVHPTSKRRESVRRNLGVRFAAVRSQTASMLAFIADRDRLPRLSQRPVTPEVARPYAACRS
jgi:hypothetical protein